MREPLLTYRQAADYLGVHPRTVRRAIAAGRLPALRVGALVRIRPSDLDEYARPIPTRRRRAS